MKGALDVPLESIPYKMLQKKQSIVTWRVLPQLNKYILDHNGVGQQQHQNPAEADDK